MFIRPLAEIIEQAWVHSCRAHKWDGNVAQSDDEDFLNHNSFSTTHWTIFGNYPKIESSQDDLSVRASRLKETVLEISRND